jgi:hypothetical protein
MNNQLPEAAKSATVKVISPSGFHWLCTVRGDENTGLLDKMLKFEEAVLAANFIPESPFAKPVTNKQPQSQDLGACSKCGAPMALSQKGKPFCTAKCWLNTV